MDLRLDNTSPRTLTITVDEFDYRVNKMTADVSVNINTEIITLSWWNFGRSKSPITLQFLYSDIVSPSFGNTDIAYNWILNALENTGGDISYDAPFKVVGINGVSCAELTPTGAGQYIVSANDGFGGFKWVID